MNAYPQRFLDLIPHSDGPVLDNGAGGRVLGGVVKMEYVHHPNNDLQGDGLRLPFRDETFGLVLSQAVLEHVVEPHTYVNEIYRVLRPGGMFYCEAAFIQPVHMAPMHYFSISPFGMAYLCRAFEQIELGALGKFSETIGWLCRESGVPSPQIREPKPDKALNAASGIYFLGRKPSLVPA